MSGRFQHLIPLAGAILAACSGCGSSPAVEPEHGPLAPFAEELVEFESDLVRVQREFAAWEATRPEDARDAADSEWAVNRLALLAAVDRSVANSVDLPRTAGWDGRRSAEYTELLGPRWSELTRTNADELEELLVRQGWFTIGSFGPEADHDAWLIVQHADSHPELQLQVLDLLGVLAEQGETAPENFAHLYDRVAVNADRPQRFGTQGRCVRGLGWEPFPCEEPDRLDELRAMVGLVPLAEYQARFAEICPTPLAPKAP
jgi:hypothetical protein